MAFSMVDLVDDERTATRGDLRSAHDGSVESWLLNVVEIDLDAEGILDECAIESQGLKDRKRSIMEYAEELKLVGNLIHSDQGFMGTAQDVKLGRTSLMESDSLPLAIKPKFEYVIRLPDDHAVSFIVGVGMGGTGKMFMLQHIFDRKARQVREINLAFYFSELLP